MIELRTFRPQTGLWEHFHPNTFVMSPLNKQITQRHTTHVNYRNSYMKVDDRLIVKQIVYKFLYCDVLLNPFVYKRLENNFFFFFFVSTVLAYLYTKRSDSEDLPIILPLGLVWCICGYNFSYCTPWKTAKISKMFWRGKILIPTTSSSNWKFQGNVNWREWERLDIFSSPKPVSCL